MTSMNLSHLLLGRYPEENPFALDPPLFNLTPWPEDSSDTPQFLAAALEVTKRNGRNPLAKSFGTCPLMLHDPRMRVADLPFTKYEEPPALQRAELSERLVFVAQIDQIGPGRDHIALFKVRLGEQVLLLKVFRNKQLHSEDKSPESKEALPMRIERFQREIIAYAHLQHYGACEAGAVPKCSGWLELSVDDMTSIAALPGIGSEWQTLNEDELPPKAVLLEFFEDAQRLNVTNISLPGTDAALRALYHIHASYVLHNDVHGRNILLLPDGRSVWVDFDMSLTASNPIDNKASLRRQDLFEEFTRAWTYIYEGLFSDHRIGFVREVY